MTKYFSILLVVAFSAAMFCIAQKPAPQIKQVPIQQTSAVSGQQMYTTYCAACHGADARGHGPAASALKIPPSDLTLLTFMNGGTFPANHVSSTLRLGTRNAAHGSVEMPIWGDLLTSLQPGARDSTLLMHERIFNLTEYLKTVQR
jgi:mono/diheme cytochrome c family protein